MNRLGLTVIEHQNADLYGEGQWTGTPDTADGHAAPLPEYPGKGDLPPSPRVAALIDTAAVLLIAGIAFVAGGVLL